MRYLAAAAAAILARDPLSTRSRLPVHFSIPPVVDRLASASDFYLRGLSSRPTPTRSIYTAGGLLFGEELAAPGLANESS